MTCVETRGGAVYTEVAEGVENFAQAYDSLRSTALTPDESATVIRSVIGRAKRAKGRST
ncbi:Scr1 family TA system antitoxin-like transcriptional regulator [Streptosporangium sp. NPDC049248]|uniref:Scr1 family TA system antitoxin-like transcriptional regulator n=1 Tax=Streptosporangium sp. NPDC049248 TaxID=3155651 RepID=UPI003447F262